MEFHTQKNSKTEEWLFHLMKVVLFIHSRSINLFNLIQSITERGVKRVLGPKRQTVSVRWKGCRMMSFVMVLFTKHYYND